MTLQKIKYFIEVAKTLNFTQAAENLFMAQPNLSKHISQMENEIGIQLFVRTKRNVTLTEAGRLLFREFEAASGQIENAIEQARAMERGENGRISIGILEGQDLKDTIHGYFENFSNQNPNVELIPERASFSRLRTGLINGYFDAVITMCFDILDNPAFNHRTLLCKGGGVIAINKDNPLSRKKNLSLYDLRNENFVTISPDESPRGYNCFLNECKKNNFVPNIIRTPKSLESMILCVEAGLGITLLDHNTRLEDNTEVCTISIPDSYIANLVIAWRTDDKRPVIQKLISTMETC